MSLPCLTSTLPSRSSRRFEVWSAITTIPFSNVTVTFSFSLLSVRMPVFRCNPMSWKMSGSPKSLIVPSRAIGGGYLTPPVPDGRGEGCGARAA